MQTILPPSGNTIKILGKARSAEHGLRWMTYVLAQPVEGGVLVFHTLTRALLLLTPEEYAAPDNLPELRDGWFRVPQEMDDMKYADQVRFIRRTMWKEPEHSGCHGEKIRCPPRCDGRGCGHGAGQPEKNWCAGCVNRPLRRRSRTMAFCFTAM